MLLAFVGLREHSLSRCDKVIRKQNRRNARQPADEQSVLAVRCLVFRSSFVFLRQPAFEPNFNNFAGIKRKSLFVSLSTRNVFLFFQLVLFQFQLFFFFSFTVS